MAVWSNYNFLIKELEHSHLLYNSRTGNLIRLNNEISKLIKADRVLDDSLFSFFSSLEFIIDESVDEVALIESKFNNEVKNRQDLSITVELTESCNFRCRYCYQDHKHGNLSKSAEDGIIRLIASRGSILERVQLNWFGGEPLLRLKDLLRISKKIGSYLKSHNVLYKQHITTNGSLLTRDVGHALLKHGIDNIQITLDGSKKSHNETRIFTSGDGTYSEVLNGCKNAVDIGMDLMVRVNLTKKNFLFVDELMCDLVDRGISPVNTIIHIVRAVDHGNLTQQISSNCFSTQEFGDIWPDMLKIVAKHGFPTPSISPVAYNCPFDLDKAIMVGMDGGVRLCSSTAEITGHLNRSNNGPSAQYSHMKSVPRRPTLDDTCKLCKCLPLCMGGCAYLEGKNEEKCNPEKYAIEELVKLYAKQNSLT